MGTWDRTQMQMRALRLLLIVAFAVAAKAALTDRVVPEDEMLDVQEPATILLSRSAPAIRGELATLAIHAHTKGEKSAIKHLTSAISLLEATPAGTAIDGGTEALATRVQGMVDTVTPVIETMQSGLETDFTTAQGDLTTLIGAINSTERTVPVTEEASITLKSYAWCMAKEALDNSTAKCPDAIPPVANFDPTIALGDAFYKNIGDIRDCPAGSAMDSATGKCPAAASNPDEGTGALKVGFQNARDEYHRLDSIKTRECSVKAADVTNAETNETAYKLTIKTFLDAHVDACAPDSTVYTTAVSSFNTNNVHRAAMYQSLDKIMCYIKNITDADACISALSTNYAAKFPAHATASPACPTRAAYALQISNYRSLSLTELWVPSDTTCPALATAVAAPTTAPSGASITQCFDSN